MRPEDNFTKKSRKRYKALRKIASTIPAPEGYVLIPGRQRAVSGPSDRVYLAMRRYKVVTPNHRRYRERRFYFYSKPKRQEVMQIVKLMYETMEES